MKTIGRMLRAILPQRCRVHAERITPADVCSRFSRGNVPVQLGRLFFDDDLVAMKKANREYAF